MTTREDRTSGYFNEKMETLSASERTAYQNESLQQIVQHAYHNAPAIRAKFDESSIKPEEVKTVKDLERVPVTHKHELASLQEQSSFWRFPRPTARAGEKNLYVAWSHL